MGSQKEPQRKTNNKKTKKYKATTTQNLVLVCKCEYFLTNWIVLSSLHVDENRFFTGRMSLK